MTDRSIDLPLDGHDEPMFDDDLGRLDLVFDRLAARRPSLDDVDDPVLADLAVLAADVDLDPVDPTVTRRTLQELGIWPTVQGVPGPRPRPARAPRREPARTPDPFPVPTGELRPVPPLSGPSLSSLPSAAAGLGSTLGPALGPALGPVLGLGRRALPALAVAGAAVVLSMGAAAAVTNGESVNPGRALMSVVQRMTADHPPTVDGRSTPPSSLPGPTGGARGASSGSGVAPSVRGAGTPSPAAPGAAVGEPSAAASPSPGETTQPTEGHVDAPAPGDPTTAPVDPAPMEPPTAPPTDEPTTAPPAPAPTTTAPTTAAPTTAAPTTTGTGRPTDGTQPGRQPTPGNAPGKPSTPGRPTWAPG